MMNITLARIMWAIVVVAGVSCCTRMENVGKLPVLTPVDQTREHSAMQISPKRPPIDTLANAPRAPGGASLRSRGRNSLHGDRRASRVGDILTVSIEIDDRAELSNNSERGRDGAENLNIPNLLGLPDQISRRLSAGTTLDPAVGITSTGRSSGEGSISRKEKLALRIAATVVQELPNGIVRIEGTQEVRVNFEVRELTISGFVRPGDISRKNEITYDKIASARISYGGRGQITDVRQPRYGQQVADILLPF